MTPIGQDISDILAGPLTNWDSDELADMLRDIRREINNALRKLKINKETPEEDRMDGWEDWRRNCKAFIFKAKAAKWRIEAQLRGREVKALKEEIAAIKADSEWREDCEV